MVHDLRRRRHRPVAGQPRTFDGARETGERRDRRPHRADGAGVGGHRVVHVGLCAADGDLFRGPAILRRRLRAHVPRLPGHVGAVISARARDDVSGEALVWAEYLGPVFAGVRHDARMELGEVRRSRAAPLAAGGRAGVWFRRRHDPGDARQSPRRIEETLRHDRPRQGRPPRAAAAQLSGAARAQPVCFRARRVVSASGVGRRHRRHGAQFADDRSHAPRCAPRRGRLSRGLDADGSQPAGRGGHARERFAVAVAGSADPAGRQRPLRAKKKRGPKPAPKKAGSQAQCPSAGEGLRRRGVAGGAPGLGRYAEKLDDVPEFGETAGVKLGFDLGQRAVEFGRGFGIQFLHAIGGFADDVIAGGLAEIDFVERGAVVEKRAPDEADLLEGRHAPVNGHEIAGAGSELRVQLLDARRGGAFVEGGKDGDARLRDAQSGGLQLGRGELDRGGATRSRFDAGQRMICLCGRNHCYKTATGLRGIASSLP